MTPARGTVRRRGPAGWTLRTRLLATLLALLASVSVVIGLVSVLALHSFLLDRLDDRLTAAAGRSHSAVGGPPGKGPGPPGLFAPGQGEGTLGARLTNGTVADAGVLDTAGISHSLRPSQLAILAALPIDGRPHTRDLGDGLGAYRLVASGSAGEELVTGLPLDPVRSAVYRLAGVVTVVALGGLVVAGLAGTTIVRLTLRPLRRVAATATRVSELPLDRGEVAPAVGVPAADTDPRTEVGQVGAALNRMLGHVTEALRARQASETRVRRFVADASHELRTPLAAIRGYTDLAQRDPTRLPPEVAHALRRVESETGRLTGLVTDLLLLARLDAGRPVERRPVDLSRLLVDAVGDAHAAGPDHGWRLDLPDEPVTVDGDEARLVQVVANLLANARTHTPAGTTVTARLAVESGVDGGTVDAVLRVVDDGPGIAPQLAPHVFERFARGDISRSRAAGSTGLGLAIVAAVVDAHAGHVGVASEPGRTEFTVRLPLAVHSRPTAVAQGADSAAAQARS